MFVVHRPFSYIYGGVSMAYIQGNNNLLNQTTNKINKVSQPNTQATMTTQSTPQYGYGTDKQHGSSVGYTDKNAEIQRTIDVINNRSEAGMDTSAQKAWYNKLTGGSYDQYQQQQSANKTIESLQNSLSQNSNQFAQQLSQYNNQFSQQLNQLTNSIPGMFDSQINNSLKPLYEMLEALKKQNSYKQTNSNNILGAITGSTNNPQYKVNQPSLELGENNYQNYLQQALMRFLGGMN